MLRPLLLPALAVLFAAAAAHAQRPATSTGVYGTVDQGIYRISVAGRPVGFEPFTWSIHFDSLIVESAYRQPLRAGDTLRKDQQLVVRTFDNDLVFYRSTLVLPGSPALTRGLTVGDTVFTLYREHEAGGGSGVTHLKPGGRLFVIESNAYALFDLLFRELASRRGWEERPVHLVLLGAADTVLTSTAKTLGTQRVRWGNTPLEARKFSLSDGRTVFYAWIGPDGRMLRLEQPSIGLIVEREPPPAKKVPARTAGPRR